MAPNMHSSSVLVLVLGPLPKTPAFASMVGMQAL